MVLVRQRTIPIERSPPVSEASVGTSLEEMKEIIESLIQDAVFQFQLHFTSGFRTNAWIFTYYCLTNDRVTAR
jgi:hypothetical protein